MFKSWLDPDSHIRIESNPGSRVVDVMAPVVDDDGRITLVVAGKHDLYSEIQSHRDSVDIHLILQRYKNGDLTALNQRAGSFMDISDMPANYHELINTITATRQYFDALDPEVRKKFDDDFGNFVESFGSQAFVDAFKVVSGDSDKASEPVKDGEDNE